MSEVAELYSAMRDESAKRRATNRENAPHVLKEQGIQFDECNRGAHLIVYGTNHMIDFWPGTGKWIARKSDCSGRGILNLVKAIKKDKL